MMPAQPGRGLMHQVAVVGGYARVAARNLHAAFRAGADRHPVVQTDLDDQRPNLMVTIVAPVQDVKYQVDFRRCA
jgi:hypothetical protein